MIGTPHVNKEKQLISAKLVLREVKIKTPDRPGDGGQFEHMANDKLDFSNPIIKIFCAENDNFYFGNKNGFVNTIKCSHPFKEV